MSSTKQTEFSGQYRAERDAPGSARPGLTDARVEEILRNYFHAETPDEIRRLPDPAGSLSPATPVRAPVSTREGRGVVSTPVRGAAGIATVAVAIIAVVATLGTGPERAEKSPEATNADRPSMVERATSLKPEDEGDAGATPTADWRNLPVELRDKLRKTRVEMINDGEADPLNRTLPELDVEIQSLDD